jgi:hypothetical protein
VACGFVQGNAVSSGPPVLYYSHIDYLAWLLSDESLWLPSEIRAFLTKGMAEWDVWIWDTRHTAPTGSYGPGTDRGVHLISEPQPGTQAGSAGTLTPDLWTFVRSTDPDHTTTAQWTRRSAGP